MAADTRDGVVVSEGWQEASAVRAVDLIGELVKLGVQGIVYTDTLRDGTLTEPNFLAIESLLEAVRLLRPAIATDPPVTVLYSGGITSIDHLLRLSRLGLDGAIVGKALYTGAIDLTAAISAVMAA